MLGMTGLSRRVRIAGTRHRREKARSVDGLSAKIMKN
jgi:hypothetical protein